MSQDWRTSYAWRVCRAFCIRRDKVCQCCTSRKSREVHHIKKAADFPEGRTDPDNCITLCRRCHHFLHLFICGGFDKPCTSHHLNLLLTKFKKDFGRAHRRAGRLLKKTQRKNKS